MDADSAMMTLLSGDNTDQYNAKIIESLDDANDSDITSMIRVMKRCMIPVKLYNDDVMDMCGTGGDQLGTFNISTAATFVAAAAGARIAKHGNRSSSGGIGSADIFEMLGVQINDIDPSAMLKGHNLCFLFAQRYHPAVRHVAGARRILSRRTVFNMLGPLCNPANVRYQLVGVSDHTMLERIPRIMSQCGSIRVMSVISKNGLDELSSTSSSTICLYKDGHSTVFSMSVDDLGISESPLSDIIPDTKQESLQYFVGGISGNATDGIVHTTALNAAAGMVVAGMVDTIPEGFDIAMDTIRSGRALHTLCEFVREFGDIAVLEGMT